MVSKATDIGEWFHIPHWVVGYVICLLTCLFVHLFVWFFCCCFLFFVCLKNKVKKRTLFNKTI